MADLTITAANVAIGGSDSQTKIVQVGEAVTHGEPLYRLSSDGKYYLGDADDAAKDDVSVLALTAAALDGYALVLTGGPVSFGAILTVGEIYVLSDTPGGIKPEGDLGSGDYVTILGVASTTSLLTWKVNASGIAIP